jgi:hypothetical protein
VTRRRVNGRHYKRWGDSRRAKQVYSSRWSAWRVVLRIWWQDRAIDSLRPYECCMNDGNWHWHIGHEPGWPRRRLVNHWRHKVVYPIKRLKSNIRLIIRTRDLRARHPPQRRRNGNGRAGVGSRA